MKKILVMAAVLCLAYINSAAQTPLTQAVDFDITFTNGEEFNLQSKLDEGKYVVIDFLFVTCGPCQANQPYFTEAYQNFGCNGG